jgi:hypothetical protein
LVTDAQIARELRTAEIEIAISKPQVFVFDFAFDRKGRDVGAIQNFQIVGHYFDFARRKICVCLPGQSGRDAAAD